MDAMLTGLQDSITTGVPVILTALAGIALLKFGIPLAIFTYNTVRGFFGKRA